jgi:hypothetical protein
MPDEPFAATASPLTGGRSPLHWGKIGKMKLWRTRNVRERASSIDCCRLEADFASDLYGAWFVPSIDLPKGGVISLFAPLR